MEEPRALPLAERAFKTALETRKPTSNRSVLGHNDEVDTKRPPTSDVGELATRIGRAFREDDGPGLVAAYLFGSHAEGRAHRESDIDVAVLLRYNAFPGARERFEERLRLSGVLQADLRTRGLDIVVLNDVPPPLGRRIVTGGLRILCTDREANHAFVRDIQLRAADLEPFLRRMRRLKLDAIER